MQRSIGWLQLLLSMRCGSIAVCALHPVDFVVIIVVAAAAAAILPMQQYHTEVLSVLLHACCCSSPGIIHAMPSLPL
jgi:hypothetical protein